MLSLGHKWRIGISWLAGEKLLTGEARAIAQCGERLRLLSTPQPASTKQLEEKQLSWPTQPGSGSTDWGPGQPGGGFPSSLLKYLWNINNKYGFCSFYFSSPDVKIWRLTSY